MSPQNHIGQRYPPIMFQWEILMNTTTVQLYSQILSYSKMLFWDQMVENAWLPV